MADPSSCAVSISVIFAAWRKICWMPLLSVASWFFAVGYNTYIKVATAMPGQHMLQYEHQISLRCLLCHINDFHVALSTFTLKGKCKTIPVQAMTGPEGPEVWGIQISRHVTREGSKVVNQLPLLHRKYSWYSFLLEVELTPGGHSAVRRIMPMKNYSNTIRNWTHDC